MSIQLKEAMTKILSMPYYKNESAKSGNYVFGHEEAVAEKFKDTGFNEVNSSKYPKLKNSLKFWADTGNDTELRKLTEGLECGSYILQPSGSQSFPDILVKDFDDRFVAVECKSSEKDFAPMWNDNLPKPNSIYVFSSGKTNSTTVFLGKDVITNDIIINQKIMISELTDVVKKYKTINTDKDMYKRGWDIKFRPQNFQSGGKNQTDYFNHPDRKKCEGNVLEYCLGIIKNDIETN